MVFDRFSSAEPINKGWSDDRKYRVADADGNEYLLRVSGAEKLEKRRALFKLMERVDALGVPMCRPIDFWERGGEPYTLLSWIHGEDAENAVRRLNGSEQYALGLEAGRILKIIHTIPAPDDTEPWSARFNRKIDRNIAMYDGCKIRFEGDAYIKDYLNSERALLEARPQCFQHGDYHIGNMMLENGRVVIIDFDRFDFGDPWEEFNRIVWCAAVSPRFASGQLDGYFGGRPPHEFFRLLALYIASNTMSSVPWAIRFGQGEVDTMLNQARTVLQWFDDMRDPVPTWYG